MRAELAEGAAAHTLQGGAAAVKDLQPSVRASATPSACTCCLHVHPRCPAPPSSQPHTVWPGGQRRRCAPRTPHTYPHPTPHPTPAGLTMLSTDTSWKFLTDACVTRPPKFRQYADMAWFHRGGLLRSTTQEERLYDLYLRQGGERAGAGRGGGCLRRSAPSSSDREARNTKQRLQQQVGEARGPALAPLPRAAATPRRPVPSRASARQQAKGQGLCLPAA